MLDFKDGLIGCPNWRQFTLRALPDLAPIVALECVSEPGVSLYAVAPHHVRADYMISLCAADRVALRLRENETPACLVIVVARRNPPDISANLAGPLVLNSRTLMGRQVVLDGDRYPLRYRIPG